MAPPLRPLRGFLCRFWVKIYSNFLAFSHGSSSSAQQVDVFTSSSQQRTTGTLSSRSFTHSVALRFSQQVHSTWQSNSTASSGVTIGKGQPDNSII